MSSIPRILFGAFPDGHSGLRVSQAGYDVRSNPVDNAKLIFNSDWSAVLPLFLSGTAALPASTTVDVSFGTTLSYIPLAYAFTDINSTQPKIGVTWEVYQTTTDLYDGGDTPFMDYINDSDAVQRVKIMLYNNKISFLSTPNASNIKYFVYRLPSGF